MRYNTKPSLIVLSKQEQKIEQNRMSKGGGEEKNEQRNMNSCCSVSILAKIVVLQNKLLIRIQIKSSSLHTNLLNSN